MRVLIATAAVGVGNVMYKYGLMAGATPASLIVVQGLAVVLLSTAFVAVVEHGVRTPVITLYYAPVAAIALACAFVLMVESLMRGDASVMVPTAQMGFGVTALFGFLFLREPFTVRKGAGLVAALTALACLALGQPSPM